MRTSAQNTESPRVSTSSTTATMRLRTKHLAAPETPEGSKTNRRWNSVSIERDRLVLIVSKRRLGVGREDFAESESEKMSCKYVDLVVKFVYLLFDST